MPEYKVRYDKDDDKDGFLSPESEEAAIPSFENLGDYKNCIMEDEFFNQDCVFSFPQQDEQVCGYFALYGFISPDQQNGPLMFHDVANKRTFDKFKIARNITFLGCATTYSAM